MLSDSLTAMRNTFADLRFAARTLLRSPWFSALAVITLAAGIGATTAVFSLVDAVLLRPLPFKDPHRLVEIWGRNDQRTGMRVPGEILEALRARAKTLQHRDPRPDGRCAAWSRGFHRYQRRDRVGELRRCVRGPAFGRTSIHTG